jgi:hypothetical protein
MAETEWLMSSPYLPEMDFASFVALPLTQKIRAVNGRLGCRLWSRQLAEIWRGLITPALPPEQRQVLLRECIALAPYAQEAEESYRQLVDIGARSGSVQRVHVIISCWKHLDKAKALHSKVAQRLAPAVIALGEPERGVAELDGPLLRLPCADSYESLPQKMHESLLAVLQFFGPAAVLKMDDDLVVEGEPQGDIAQRLAAIDYAGEAAGNEDFDRCWHIGKTENPEVPLYGRRHHGLWGRGPLYHLSARAAELLAREFVFYPGEMAGEVYEDKLMGDVLRRHGISLALVDIGALFGLRAGNETAPKLGGKS